jgi:hypothetical protein
MKTTGMKVLALIFIVLGLGVAAVGVYKVLGQDRQIRTFIPTEAWVDSTQLLNKRGSKGSVTYQPEVNYHYTYQGRVYQSSRTLVIEESSNNDWARSVLNRYPAGRPATAYVNPNRPGDAYIHREHTFIIYLLILIPSVFVGVGMGLWMQQSSRRDGVGNMIPDGSGWCIALPDSSLQQRLRSRRWLALFGTVWGGLVLGHYALVSNLNIQVLFLISATAYLALAGTLVGMYIYTRNLLAHISEPVLRLQPEHISLGQQIQVELSVLPRANINIAMASVSLICQELIKIRSGNKTQIRTVTQYTSNALLAKGVQTIPDHELVWEGMLIGADHCQPSTDDSFSEYPRTQWLVRVNIALTGSADYKGDYFISVT